LIDSSTIDPAVSRAMAEAAKAKGAIFVDAPVSGGVNAAAAGTLTFMVGADKAEDFEAAQKVLAFMGKSITHCGQVGTGQAVKVVIFSFFMCL
jgi:3-hydroxyisobutyrate dehydrogenase